MDEITDMKDRKTLQDYYHRALAAESADQLEDEDISVWCALGTGFGGSRQAQEVANLITKARLAQLSGAKKIDPSLLWGLSPERALRMARRRIGWIVH